MRDAVIQRRPREGRGGAIETAAGPSSLGSWGGAASEGTGGLRRPFAGAGRGGRVGRPRLGQRATRWPAPACAPAESAPSASGPPLAAVSPSGQRPGALLGTGPRPPPPNSGELSLRPPLPCFTSSSKSYTPRPAARPPSIHRVAPRVGACTAPAPRYRATLHPGPGSSGAGSPRLRRPRPRPRLGGRAGGWGGAWARAGLAARREVAARSPEPECPGPGSGSAAGWGLASLQQEDARS